MLSDLARTGTLEDVRSQVAGKKRRLRRWATVAVAASAVLFGASTPAHAIRLPDPFSCAWNKTVSGDYLYLKIRGSGQVLFTPVCFVDAGTMNPLAAYNVIGLHSGNNAGIIGGTNVLRAFSKWEDDWVDYGQVKVLTIY